MLLFIFPPFSSSALLTGRLRSGSNDQGGQYIIAFPTTGNTKIPPWGAMRVHPRPWTGAGDSSADDAGRKHMKGIRGRKWNRSLCDEGQTHNKLTGRIPALPL